jgi:hypothetical protein
MILKQKLSLIMMIFIIFLAACSSKPKTDWTTQEREEIYAVVKEYKNAINEKDYEKVLAAVDKNSPMRTFLISPQYKESFEAGKIEKDILSIDLFPIEEQYVEELEGELDTSIENIVTVITVESIQTEQRLKQLTGGYILKNTDGNWKIWSVETIAVDKDTATVHEGVLIIKAAEIAHASTGEIPPNGWTHQHLSSYVEEVTEQDYVVIFDQEKDQYLLSNHAASEVITGNRSDFVSVEQLSQYK